jgi:CheY-like chemotaxis protein
VDDYPDTVESLSLLLRYWGHDVRVAGDGPSALEQAAAYHPDVVLLDIGLPRMSGCEVARQLRGQPGPGRPTLISLSGFGAEEDRRRALEAGCDQFLIKPVDPNALEVLLAACPHAGGGDGR